MMAGCYTLDLYCDAAGWNDCPPHAWGEFPHQFTAETFIQCKRQAVKRGWIFNDEGKHICPKCAKDKK